MLSVKLITNDKSKSKAVTPDEKSCYSIRLKLPNTTINEVLDRVKEILPKAITINSLMIEDILI